MADQLSHLQKQQRTLQENLRLLHETLDEAAEKGNIEAVKELQADIAATGVMITSCDRRIEKAKVAKTEAEKEALKAENLAAVEILGVEMQAAANVAAKLDKTISTLVDELKELHTHGTAARRSLHHLVKQLPDNSREGSYTLLHAASFHDSTLAFLIESALQRAGVFEHLAPHPGLNLTRFDTGSIGEGVALRAEKLTRSAQHMAQQVNQVI